MIFYIFNTLNPVYGFKTDPALSSSVRTSGISILIFFPANGIAFAKKNTPAGRY
jgi:hypothetical protein